MRKKTPCWVEHWRITSGRLASDASAGRNGAFSLPHRRDAESRYAVIVSDGGGWDHVSVHVMRMTAEDSENRTPEWEDMAYLKQVFFLSSECVVQFHPATERYINQHPHTLHLWRPQNVNLPQPELWMV